MEISKDGTAVTIRMTEEEAARMSVALGAGYESVSRAEYFIRTGLAEEAVRAIARVLRDGVTGMEERLPLEPGVEAQENPRRPRPPR